MTEFIPSEKGVPIRMPSVANLQVDSADRGVGMTSGNFQITRNNNLMNGFFTRVGATEMALDWRVPNVGPTEWVTDASNNLIRFDVSGASVITPYSIVVPTGTYTCAEVIDYFCAVAGVLTGSTFTGSLVGQYPTITSSASAIFWRFTPDPALNKLMGDLGFSTVDAVFRVAQAAILATTASTLPLQKWKYLDIVSPQLTLQQDVKDNTTSKYYQKDSLYRFYLAYTSDSPNQKDKYGYTIYPTNQKFYCRRMIYPPKMIKWEPNIPIGNTAFEVWATRWFDPDSNNPGVNRTSLLNTNEFSYQMTLQVSEV